MDSWHVAGIRETCNDRLQLINPGFELVILSSRNIFITGRLSAHLARIITNIHVLCLDLVPLTFLWLVTMCTRTARLTPVIYQYNKQPIITK